ncbi:MAG: NifB/NifX family molybdenum-iron cluster-binding protein [Bacteroidales bacterium]|nr:NifB/NifX family molybdenum-iron cluster-binding protein [Bacteroidales bacterium]
MDDHFGHCEYYGIYTVSDENEISDFKVLSSKQGCGCKSNIASDLANIGVSIMLTGGIGAGAINVLNSAGIEVVRGCSGDAKNVVEQYITGNISDSGQSCSEHENHHQHGHDHGHGHTCNH